MTSYRAPVEDLLFVIGDYLRLSGYSNLPGFEEATPELLDAVLGEAGKLATEVLLPLHEVGDRKGCSYDPATKRVTTPPGFADAYKAFTEGGWTSVSADPDYGGQGLPALVDAAVNEIFASANWAFAMYPGLASGVSLALATHGSDEQKQLYLPKLVSGEWAGTMNLTEPHCGTDLGLLRTAAQPLGDGSYALTGTKIFISGGEQDLTPNIVHLVLARLPDAPEGTRGISLFVCPKILTNSDGDLGEPNALSCGGIEHKMGINGSATCTMNYEGAKAWLVGEPHKGLRAMFTLMNEARLAVGVQGLAASEIAYQNAVEYAKERLQGRSLSGPKNPDGPADPIIVHPDVRRMLMEAKCFNEGARALIMWTALKADLEHRSPDEKTRETAGDLVALMTPVIKAYVTDKGFACAVLCQQVYGGAGYLKDHPAEQFVRDARIGMVYEGANGVQAMDLVGRKLPANGGRALMSFSAEIDALLAETEGDEFLEPWRAGLSAVRAQLQDGTMWLMQNAMTERDNAGAAAHDYLNLTALTALAFIWLGLARAAKAGLDAGTGDTSFFETKLATARYFLARILPDAGAHLAKLKSGADPVMALGDEQF